MREVYCKADIVVVPGWTEDPARVRHRSKPITPYDIVKSAPVDLDIINRIKPINYYEFFT